jgi:hypothetical protein
MSTDPIDQGATRPDILQYHDKAIMTMIELKKRVGKTRLNPNMNFDNSPSRDLKMYQISDLTNLDSQKYFQDHSLDRLLEIQGVITPFS